MKAFLLLFFILVSIGVRPSIAAADSKSQDALGLTCSEAFQQGVTLPTEIVPSADLSKLPALIRSTDVSAFSTYSSGEIKSELTREIIQRLAKDFIATQSLSHEDVQEFISGKALNKLREVSFIKKLWAFQFRPFSRSRLYTDALEQSIAQYQTFQWEDQLQLSLKLSLLIIEFIESETLFDILIAEKMSVEEAKQTIAWLRLVLKLDSLALPLIVTGEMLSLSEAKLKEISNKGFWKRFGKAKYPRFKRRFDDAQVNRYSIITQASTLKDFEGEMSEVGRILLFSIGFLKSADSQSPIPKFEDAREKFPPGFAEKFGAIVDSRDAVEQSVPEKIERERSAKAGDEELLVNLREELATHLDMTTKRREAWTRIDTLIEELKEDPRSNYSHLQEILDIAKGLFEEDDNYRLVVKYLDAVQVVHLRRSENDRLAGKTFGSKANYEEAEAALALLLKALPYLPISEMNTELLRRDLTSSFPRRLLPTVDKYPKAKAAKAKLMELLNSEKWYQVKINGKFQREFDSLKKDLEERISQLEKRISRRESRLKSLTEELSQAREPFDITEQPDIIDRFAPWLSIVGGIQVNMVSGGLITTEDGDAYIEMIPNLIRSSDITSVLSLISRDELLLGHQINRVMMNSSEKIMESSTDGISGDLTEQNLFEMSEFILERKAAFNQGIENLRQQSTVIQAYIQVISALSEHVVSLGTLSSSKEIVATLDAMESRVTQLNSNVDRQLAYFEDALGNLEEAEDTIRRGGGVRNRPALPAPSDD